jgi:hypothetical protein
VGLSLKMLFSTPNGHALVDFLDNLGSMIIVAPVSVSKSANRRILTNLSLEDYRDLG